MGETRLPITSGKRVASGYKSGNDTNLFSVSGIGFKPKSVLIANLASHYNCGDRVMNAYINAESNTKKAITTNAGQVQNYDLSQAELTCDGFSLSTSAGCGVFSMNYQYYWIASE